MDIKITSVQDLEKIKNNFIKHKKIFKYTAHVCYGAGCVSSECMEVKEEWVHIYTVYMFSHNGIKRL